MTTKRIMRKFTIREISGVDRPAQVGARAIIMKRDFSEDERKDDAKSGTALPDGSFPIESTEDLKNAIQAYGRAKDKPAAAAHIKSRAKALGAEDQLPSDGDLKKSLCEGYGDPRLLSDVDGHSHMIDLAQSAGHSSYDKMEGEEYGHTHPWVVTMAGDIVIGAAMGHTHEVLAKRETNGGNTVGDTKQPTVEEVSAKLAKAESDLVRANAINALNDSERAMFKSLSQDKQDSFLALSPSQRSSEITKAAGENPVVYTDSEGQEFHKNDDPRMIGMAKRADADRTARIASEAKVTRQGFEKRATDELPNLPGDVNVKVEVLKALDSIQDSTLKAGALALLKAGNDAMTKAFAKSGTKQGHATESNDSGAANDQLETLAKRYAAEKGVDFYAAYDEVSKQHPELLKTAVEG